MSQLSHTRRTHGEISLRTLDHAVDGEAVRRLAELDSHEPLTGEAIGAEVDGRLVAAVEIATGRTIADPFTRTSEIRALLILRASQLAEPVGRTSRRSTLLRRRARGGRRGRPAVGGSPAGQIITLPRVN